MSGWYGSTVFRRRQCTHCGVEYQPGSGASRFCSKACWSTVRNAKDYYQTYRQYERVNQNPRKFWVRLLHGRGKGKAGCRSLLTPEFLEAMYVTQGGKCAVSGRPMNCELKVGGDWSRCSIDRIDNQLGYTLNNVHLVCKGVNLSRNDQSLDDYVKLCEDVVRHRGL